MDNQYQQPQGQWQGQLQPQSQGQWQGQLQPQSQGQWQGQPQPQSQGQWQGQPQLQGQYQQPQGQWQGQPQGQYQQGQWQGQQNPYLNQQFQQGNYQMQNPMQQGGSSKSKFFLVLIAVLIVGISFVVLKSQGLIGGSKEPEPEVAVDPNQLNNSACNSLISAFKNLQDEDTAVALDATVGSGEGDSFLAQEWAYVNRVVLREQYIQKVAQTVQFNSVSGDTASFVIPDYAAIATQMDNDENKALIRKLFKSSKYNEKDYEWQDEMNNLFCQYMIDYVEFPTKTIEISIPISNGRVSDDSELDKVLFSSQEFHNCITRFSQISTGFTGVKKEKYKTRENQKNPEYNKWYKLFKKYYDADNGKFHKGTSKWEPWYVRDDDNNIVLDKNGKKKVNYYSIKKEDGTDWIQPDEYVKVEVTKTRNVDDPWIDETGCTFVFLGTYYIQNEYTGKNDTTFRVGDGTRQFPAGIGTTIITKAMDTKGKWHDVRVALLGYWTGQDAIDYAEMFDKRNRGFTTESVIDMMTYEVSIENLEDKTIDIVSAMSLFDANSNRSSRTGTMYGFTEHIKIKPHKKVLINDWATSTELDQKYVCWGKDFDRTASIVYFNILAGSGYIPHYSAYDYFTGQSVIDNSVNIQNTTENGEDAVENE